MCPAQPSAHIEQETGYALREGGVSGVLVSHNPSAACTDTPI
jgi:hypothetical protein